MTTKLSGFTLFEVVVTLAVLSITLALVGPSLVLHKPGADEALTNLIFDSRRLATRRAQTMHLEVTSNGSWTLSSDISGERPPVIRSGNVVAGNAFQIRISPLGICIPEASATAFRIDPLTCSLAKVQSQ